MVECEGVELAAVELVVMASGGSCMIPIGDVVLSGPVMRERADIPDEVWLLPLPL